ncbi:hypothetical protein SPPN_00075 [Streptococcus pseudopneumoniae IS7493]|nr:hypothetical protein SPPN_00075 [Streptococcus pseudopneumoniae IS7493]
MKLLTSKLFIILFIFLKILFERCEFPRMGLWRDVE